jgi:hypothetical protein
VVLGHFAMINATLDIEHRPMTAGHRSFFISGAAGRTHGY